MRPLLITFFFFFLWLNLSAQDVVIPLQSANNQASIKSQNFNISELQMHFRIDALYGKTVEKESHGNFIDLYFGKGYSSSKVGSPKLPSFSRLIQIPNGASVSVKVNGYSESELLLSDYGINTQLYPQQPSYRKDQDIDTIPLLIKADRYSQATFNDNPIAQIEVLGTLRGIRIARVQVNPVRYSPAAGIIKVFNDIDVEVSMQGGDVSLENKIRAATYSPYFEPVFAALQNPYTKSIYDEKPDLTKNPVKMLVISHRMFEESLKPFIEWKTKKGFAVTVAYTDAIGSTSDQIKSYIQGVYQAATESDPAPSFLVIVGDTPQVPASQTGSETGKQTDLYYASIDGDYFPEMYYGRMSAETTEQLDNIIYKILYYEQYQFDDPTYLNNATLIAGYDSYWNPNIGEATLKYATKNYFNSAQGYNNVWGYGVTSDPSNPNNQAGYMGSYDPQRIAVGFINYTAHCNETSWDQPRLNVNDISTFTNLNKYPVAIGNCCLSANFGYSQPSIGESWIRGNKKGAVTYIGSSPNTYWFEDFYWAVGAFPIAGNNNGYVPSFEETSLGAFDAPRKSNYVTVGGIVFAGNLAVTEAHLNNYPDHIGTEYYWQAYNVLGDPSLSPYFTEADINNVSFPTSYQLGSSFFTVSALPGSYVAISKNGVLYGASFVGSSGQVDVPVEPILEAGAVDLVITKPQYIPYFGSTNVEVNGKSYVFISEARVDDSQGNNNAAIDYGESISLDLDFKNIGDLPASNVQVEFSSLDEYTTLTSAKTISIGDFGTDLLLNIKTIPSAFSLKIDKNIPNGHRLIFSFTLTIGTETSKSDIVLVARAPVLSIGEASIDDTDGNNNGKIDAGETVTLIVPIHNDGTSQLPAGEAIITAQSSEFFSIITNSQNFPEIPAGGSLNLHYTVKASPDAPLEAPVLVNVDAQAGVFQKSATVNLLIGQFPKFIMQNNDSVSVSVGRFYDSGGPSGDYSNNEDYIMTFYPSETGMTLSFTFNYAVIEGTTSPWDKLYIYDGVNTDAPFFTGSPYSGSSGVEIGTVTATNSYGAITFHFKSDYSQVYEGWEAVISSINPLYRATFEVDNTKSEAITNAQIKIDGREEPLFTAEDGKVGVDLLNGKYSFTVNADGYNEFVSHFEVSGRDLTVPIRIVPLGAESNQPLSIAVYPIPFSEILYVKEITNAEYIEIIDILGRVQQRVKVNGQSQIQLITENLPNGTYLLQITYKSGERVSTKIVK